MSHVWDPLAICFSTASQHRAFPRAISVVNTAVRNPEEVGKHWEHAFTKTASTRWQLLRQRTRCWHPDEHNKHPALLIKFPYSALPQHTALKIRAEFSHIWERWPAAAAAPAPQAQAGAQSCRPCLPLRLGSPWVLWGDAALQEATSFLYWAHLPAWLNLFQ